MKQHELDITIDKTGKVQVHIQGIKGKKCLDIAKMLEEMVGKIQETSHTSEFYEPEGNVGIDGTVGH